MVIIIIITIITIIIIIKRMTRAPIYHTRWEHRALYNNTHTHTHTLSVGRGDRQGCQKTVQKQLLNRCVLRAALKEEAESEWRSV